MKKIIRNVCLCLFVLCFAISPFLLSGCNFSVSYKGTSENLDNALSKVGENANFAYGYVYVGLKAYPSTRLPKVNSNFKNDSSYYTEVNLYYDSMFSYLYQYMKDGAKLLATPPTVESLTEKQEDMYQNLNMAIDEFSTEIDTFVENIENINLFYNNTDAYGENSKEVYVLNYKRAYGEFLKTCFDVANGIDDILASVYTEVDYKEYDEKSGTVFKSLEAGFNNRIFEGFFSFIIDSFNCRVPNLAVDANEYMKEIVSTYENARKQYLDYFTAMKSAIASVSFSKEEIEYVQDIVSIYFEETELFQNAYDAINFEQFFFNDDCSLDRYVEGDFANRNYYQKITDYINYTLPNLTSYIKAVFYA